ncbi:MAG: hypothetical protein JXR96_16250 [Deltaproteobacteria bacterium]|nr:hypothetical protein [Deltaproteobacteria bacterium]
MKRTTLTCFLSGLLVLAACDNAQNLSSTELAQRSAAISSQLARELVSSLSFLEGLESFEALGELFDMLELGGDGGSGGDVPPLPAPMPPEEGGSGMNADEIAAEIEDFLLEQLFAPERLESEQGDLAVFLLDAAWICEAGGDDSGCEPWYCEPGDTLCEQEAQAWVDQCMQDQADEQAQCVSTVSALEIRIELATDGDGVAISLLLGPERLRVLRLGLQPDSVRLDVSLGDVRDALVFVSGVLGEEPIEMPEVFEGRLSISLTRNGEQDFTLEQEIAEAIQVRMHTPDGGAIELEVEAAAPAAMLRIQGLAERIEAGVDANRVQLSLPFGEIFDSGEGALIVDLAGLEAGLELSAGDPVVHLTGLGLGEGTSRVSHDSAELLSVDLLAGDGRHFEAEISADASGMPLVDVSPGVLAQVYVDIGHLDPYLDPGEEEPAPPELCDQTYEIELIPGGDGHTQLLPIEGDDVDPDMLKVVAGGLRLGSTAAESDFEAEAGECIAPAETCPDGAHELIDCLETRACP